MTESIDETERVPPRANADPGTVGVAVYDASCLFSKQIRFLLLAFAVHGTVRARWSRRLLQETAASLAGRLRGDSLEDLGRWLKTETDLVRDGLVEQYESWLAEISLPDPDDAHVVAAAIECGATTIVTSNLRDFPDAETGRYGIVAKHPDDFILECIGANAAIAARILDDHPDAVAFVNRIRAELPKSAERLANLIS